MFCDVRLAHVDCILILPMHRMFASCGFAARFINRIEPGRPSLA